MLLVLLLAPLLTGFVRKVKARLLRRQGPPLLQPYRDLIRLMRKEVVLADNASWLFRVIPYLIFAATWVAASLVPTFRTGLLFSWTADLIAIIALLGSARFFLALAGLDVGTDFGGIGSSREVMIASLAEPAMLMIVFTLALIAGSTQLSTIAAFMNSPEVGLRVSLGLGLIALIIVAIAENARIPVDNPATHLELTMVHEAMVLEYSGRHLALIELSAFLKLLLYVSLIACLFAPWGIAPAGAAPRLIAIGVAAYVGKLAVGGFLLAVFETSIAKMRVFRVPEFLGAALMLALLGDAAALRVEELLMHGLTFDIAHLLAGTLVLVSFLELYQDRLSALINVYAAHALVLTLSVAWQAFVAGRAASLRHRGDRAGVQGHRHSGGAAPDRRPARHPSRDRDRGRRRPRHARRHRRWSALSMVVMLRVTAEADPLAREDLAFALSVVLLGLLMMVTRRNAVSQVIGFMSLENGLVLAATGAKGMPLVVEIQRRLLGADRLHRDRHLPVPHPRALRHRRHAGARPIPRRAAMRFDALDAVLLIPLVCGGDPRRAARLPADRAAQCGRRAADVPDRGLAVLGHAAVRRLSAGRRPQQGLHRADHLRRLHHQRVQRELYRPRDRDRPADADLRALLSRDVPGADVRA